MRGPRACDRPARDIWAGSPPRQRLDLVEVAHCLHRREAAAIAGREMRRARLQKADALGLACTVSSASAKPSSQVRIAWRISSSSWLTLTCGRHAFVAAHDIVDACQHGIVDGRRRGRHAPVKGMRQDVMDALARHGCRSGRAAPKTSAETKRSKRSKRRNTRTVGRSPRCSTPCAMAKRSSSEIWNRSSRG